MICIVSTLIVYALSIWSMNELQSLYSGISKRCDGEKDQLVRCYTQIISFLVASSTSYVMVEYFKSKCA